MSAERNSCPYCWHYDCAGHTPAVMAAATAMRESSTDQLDMPTCTGLAELVSAAGLLVDRLPGESRKGDTAGRVSAHRLDRMGTVVVGTLLPYDESQGERVRDDAGVVWAVEADSVRPAEWNRENRSGDTAATDLPRWRVTHDPNTDGSSFVGDLYRYNGARWEGQANDGTWVQSAYGGVDDMRRWGYGLSEVPPAQSGEATA